MKVKKKAKKESLFHFQNRILREKGLSYMGRKSNNEGEELERREAKKLLPCCNERNRCRKPTKDGKYKCLEVKHEDRQALFDSFWKLNWSARKVFVKTMAVRSPPKRVVKSDRTSSWVYYMNLASGKRVRVCQRMLSSSCGIPDSTMKMWLTETTETKDKENPSIVSSQRANSNEKRNSVKNFLETLENVPSH
jgi:hypothetical protein